MKTVFYILNASSANQKKVKGFSNTDNHGDFILFPIEFSKYFEIGTLLESPSGIICVNDVDIFFFDKNKMLRLYYENIIS